MKRVVFPPVKNPKVRFIQFTKIITKLVIFNTTILETIATLPPRYEPPSAYRIGSNQVHGRVKSFVKKKIEGKGGILCKMGGRTFILILLLRPASIQIQRLISFQSMKPEQTRYNVYKTVCTQQMIVHNGGTINNAIGY